MVCALFAALGAEVVSADQLARETVSPGSVTLAKIVARFGEAILTPEGELDRPRLAAAIFSDAEARRDLNQIIHPAIARLSEERLAALRQNGPPLILYEAPLLFEAGAEKRVDKVLVVTIDPELQRQRLMARDGIDRIEAERRIASQMSQQEKIARADYLLDNSGSMEESRQQVESLFARLLGISPPDDKAAKP